MIQTIHTKSPCLGAMHLVVVRLITKRWAVKISQSMDGFPLVEDSDHPWDSVATFETESEANYCKNNLANIWAKMIHVDTQLHD